MTSPRPFGFAVSNLRSGDEPVLKDFSLMPAELQAAISWSVASEPGDEFAGYLRAALGAAQSMALIRNRDERKIVEQLAASNQSELGESRFGDIQKVVSQSFERYCPRITSAALAAAWNTIQANRGWVVVPNDEDWPLALEDLGWAAPPLLWGLGDRAQLHKLARSVSVVGSRGATGYGEWVTIDLVSDLVSRGFAIVSGGAYGIDGIAHRAALQAQGITFAVMAGGVNQFYPAGNQALLSKVRDQGAVIAELPPGAMPTKWRFLQRNRLVAALSQATLVVEAGRRSGSISTANHAFALSRPVGAVPGPITSSASIGTNRLIADGFASLVTSGSDVAQLAGDSNELLMVNTSEEPGSSEVRALDALGSKPLDADTIATQAGLTSAEAAIALSNLLLLGRVREANGLWSRVQPNRS